jgi:hypothetical protein
VDGDKLDRLYRRVVVDGDGVDGGSNNNSGGNWPIQFVWLSPSAHPAFAAHVASSYRVGAAADGAPKRGAKGAKGRRQAGSKNTTKSTAAATAAAAAAKARGRGKPRRLAAALLHAASGGFLPLQKTMEFGRAQPLSTAQLVSFLADSYVDVDAAAVEWHRGADGKALPFVTRPSSALDSLLYVVRLLL